MDRPLPSPDGSGPTPGGKPTFWAIEQRRALERQRALKVTGQKIGQQGKARPKTWNSTPEAGAAAPSRSTDVQRPASTTADDLPHEGSEESSSDHPPTTSHPSPIAKKKKDGGDEKKPAQGGGETRPKRTMRKHVRRPKGSCVNCTSTKKRCDGNVPSCARCARMGITCMVGPLTKEEFEKNYAVPKFTKKKKSDKALRTVLAEKTAASSTSEVPQVSPSSAALGPSSAVQPASPPGPSLPQPPSTPWSSPARERLTFPTSSIRDTESPSSLNAFGHPRTTSSDHSTPSAWLFRSPAQASSAQTSRSGWTSSRQVSPSPAGRRSASPSRAGPSRGMGEGRSGGEEGDTPDKESDEAAEGVSRMLKFGS
ncbi:hypothetical protein IAT38_007104 [Cryptococcus sp. DSM 104549]